MRILFAISIVALMALLWAAFSMARHVRRARRRRRRELTGTPQGEPAVRAAFGYPASLPIANGLKFEELTPYTEATVSPVEWLPPAHEVPPPSEETNFVVDNAGMAMDAAVPLLIESDKADPAIVEPTVTVTPAEVETGDAEVQEVEAQPEADALLPEPVMVCEPTAPPPEALPEPETEVLAQPPSEPAYEDQHEPAVVAAEAQRTKAPSELVSEETPEEIAVAPVTTEGLEEIKPQVQSPVEASLESPEMVQSAAPVVTSLSNESPMPVKKAFPGFPTPVRPSAVHPLSRLAKRTFSRPDWAYFNKDMGDLTDPEVPRTKPKDRPHS